MREFDSVCAFSIKERFSWCFLKEHAGMEWLCRRRRRESGFWPHAPVVQ
jgi:hypothetical protein